MFWGSGGLLCGTGAAEHSGAAPTPRPEKVPPTGSLCATSADIYHVITVERLPVMQCTDTCLLT